MGFLRWLRGDDSTATAVFSAGLAEIDGLFRPSKHKQTEHVEETKRRRLDVANGAGIDLDRGVVVLRRPATDTQPAADNDLRATLTESPHPDAHDRATLTESPHPDA